MFKRKSKLFINDAQVRMVRKEIVKKRKKGNGVEESAPLGNNDNSEFLRSFNALMRTPPPDFNRFLRSSL